MQAVGLALIAVTHHIDVNVMECECYGLRHSKTHGIISSYLAKICTNENQEVIYLKYLESNEIPREIFHRSTDWI